MSFYLIQSTPAVVALMVSPQSWLHIWMFYVLERWFVYMGMFGVIQQLAQTFNHSVMQATQFVLTHQIVLLQWLDVTLVIIRCGMMVAMGYEMVRTSMEWKQKQMNSSSNPLKSG